MNIPIISGLISLGNTYLEGRNKKVAAKAEAEATVIKNKSQQEGAWEAIMAANSATSWKDEYLTIVFSIPMILCFFPSMVDRVEAGFTALESMPEWYQYTLSVIVGASFAVRSAIGWKRASK